MEEDKYLIEEGGGGSEKLFTYEFVNVLHLSISFLLLFTSYNTTQNLESILNGSHGLASLGVLYISFSLSSILLANTVLDLLNPRMSLVLGSFCYFCYIGGNLSIIPGAILYVAAIITGFGASVLWTAQGVYLQQNSNDTNMGRHSGVFWSIFQLNSIVGNLIAQFVLNSNDGDGCGDGSLVDNILIGFFAALTLVSVISFFFLRKSPVEKKSVSASINIVEEEWGAPVKKKLDILSVFKLLADLRILHIVPMMIYIGITVPVYFGFITSRIGSGWSGYMMTIFGIFDTLGSVLAGQLSDKFGRLPVVIFGAVSSIIGLILIFFAGVCRTSEDVQSCGSEEVTTTTYQCSSHVVALFFAGAVMNGLADGVFNTQNYALIGDYFNDNATTAYALNVFVKSTTSGAFFFLIIWIPFAAVAGIMTVLVLLTVCTTFLLTRRFEKVSSVKDS